MLSSHVKLLDLFYSLHTYHLVRGVDVDHLSSVSIAPTSRSLYTYRIGLV